MDCLENIRPCYLIDDVSKAGRFVIDHNHFFQTPQYTSQAAHSLRLDACVATALDHYFWQNKRISFPELAFRWDDRDLKFVSTTMSQMGGR
jgi:hypothetical protein